MTRNDPLASVKTRNVLLPVTEKARPNQVLNHDGGFVFSVDDETRLRRFLILGTTGGTYYQGERELTRENSELVFKLAESNPVRLVQIVREISLSNRAPKQNPTIFALAVATTSSSLEGRKAAYDALPDVVRTASHLTLFASYVENLRGWGSGLKRAVQNWYDKPSDKLAYQLLKYRARNGFTQRDLLRLVHPRAKDVETNALFSWVTKGELSGDEPALVRGFVKAQNGTTSNEWVDTLKEYNLSWEMLPDAALNDAAVWNELLVNGVPLTALIRQLPRLTNLGVIGNSLAKRSRTDEIVAKLTDQEYLNKSGIHPFNVLVAHSTYSSGKGTRSRWTPERKIVDALDNAFYKSFSNVEPANKRTLIAIDVSLSMTWDKVLNSNLTPRDVSAAFSLVTVATEPKTFVTAFSNDVSPLGISPRQSLREVIRTVSNKPPSGTNVAAAIQYAQKNDLEVDTFLIITDNEVNRGVHPQQALEQYRKVSGIDSKLVVSAMTATDFTVGDPADPRVLNIAGIDSAYPTLVSNFSAGRI